MRLMAETLEGNVLCVKGGFVHVNDALSHYDYLAATQGEWVVEWRGHWVEIEFDHELNFPREYTEGAVFL